MSVLFLSALATPVAHSQTLTVLYSFRASGGAYPISGVISDSDGNLYGTTNSGGAFAKGTVFEVKSQGVETVLYSFMGGTDGNTPSSSLVRDSAGNLYGTTAFGGGSGPPCLNYGCGTVFRVDSTGTETVLYRFAGAGKLKDGSYPRSVIRDSAGNLYGTTTLGGWAGYGTVYKLDAAGHETVLHSFSATTSDGNGPNPGLLLDSVGNLYGTTLSGGPVNGGIIFKLSPNGKETVLHGFGFKDGVLPLGGLVSDAAGNLYGTTSIGNTEGIGDGTLFKLDPNGTYTVLYNFTAADGQPSGTLVRDSGGNFYGTTQFGGQYGFGSIFKVDSVGNETVLYSFTGGSDGKYPVVGTLVRDTGGNLYGATLQGGSGGIGVVFKLKP